MALTSPRTWVVGEILTAALLNTHLRDNLNYVLAPPIVHLLSTAALSPATGVATQIAAWATEIVDQEPNVGTSPGMHDPATNPSRITIRTAGKYVFTSLIEWGAGTAAGILTHEIRKNAGAYWRSITSIPAVAFSSQVNTPPLACAANDFFEVYVTQTSGAARSATLASPYSPSFSAQFVSL